MISKEQAETLTHEELLVAFLSNQKESQQKIQNLEQQNSSLEQQNSSLEQRSSSLERKNSSLEQQNINLNHQLNWFKRQLFGEKSERRLPAESSLQLHLGELLEDDNPPPEAETIKQYQRRRRPKESFEGTPEDSGLRFDESSVPMEIIELPSPEIKGLTEDEYEIIGEKSTYRLAQRPGSYLVLKYVRKTVKIKRDNSLTTVPAPAAVIEKSYADVSFLVGLLIDKFRYHLPLYRQHERLLDAGVKLSRVTLTNLVHSTAALLEPIYFAQLSSILQSEVLLMDETPVKAGRKGKGKMKKGYFWPILGEQGEIAFPFSASRAEKVVREALSSYCGVLLTDGYKVYEKYCNRINEVTHAQCWAHTRRKFVEAEEVEPELVAAALEKIRTLYKIEEKIRTDELEDEKKLLYRAEKSKPVVEDFFSWLEGVFSKQVLLPSNPFTKAVNYALQRESALKVFLEYPNVALDTNKLEGALRPIPMGRKAWLFCWTETGARYTGIVQSLIQSCRMQGIDSYTYLVDVLQRIDTHPARDVHLLTPRLWKDNFSQNPLLSDVDRSRNAGF